MGISASRHMRKRGQGSSPQEEPPAKLAKPDAARSSDPSSRSGAGDPHALLDPTLVALREELAAGMEQPLESFEYSSFKSMDEEADPRADGVLSKLLDLRLVGSGATGLPEAVTYRLHLIRLSGYYRTAVQFGEPITELHLGIGHAGLLLLLDAIHAPASLQLTALSAVDLLQAALYLQVETVTERVLFLLASMLPPRLYPALLRVPAVLENQEAVGEMRRSVKALFPKLPLQQVVALLAAFPEVQAKSVLNDDILQSPTRCRVLQVLCEFAKINEQFATSCLSADLFVSMSYGELEACGLYLQARLDVPLAFASAAMLRVIAAMGSRLQSDAPQPYVLVEGWPEQVLAAWVPCEGALSERVVVRAAEMWENELSCWVDSIRPELDVTPADPQVSGSKMFLTLRPLWHSCCDLAKGPHLPAGFSMTVFAFTGDGFLEGRLGPTKVYSGALVDTRFLRKASKSAFVCPDGRRRLLVGVQD